MLLAQSNPGGPVGRLVDPKQPGVRAFSAEKGVRRPDIQDYFTRGAKYVPSEIIAAYLTGLPIITGSTTGGETLRTVLYAVLLGACFISTPFYLKLMAEPGQPKRLHMWVGTFAFLIWAYGIGGLFTDLGWYVPAIAALLVLIFSLVSGLLIPAAGSK